MLHDIGSAQYHCEYRPRPPKADTDYLLSYQNDRILLKNHVLPRISDVCSLKDHEIQFLFEISGMAFYLADVSKPEEDIFTYESIHVLRGLSPQWMAFAGVTGYHLSVWYHSNQYCGVCGTKRIHKKDERALVCPDCGHILYPSMAVAIIVAIVDGDRILYTKYAGRPYGNYALIAGFVEIGETLEAAVHREVMEEVGLKVKNLRYFGNQPWGFSQSTLVGFFADLDGSPDITLDQNELAVAVWMNRDELSPIDTSVSLTSTMMEAFRMDMPISHPVQ